MKPRTGLFRYVPWTQLDDYHRRGWFVVVTDMGHHGEWSCLCWHCECGEVEP